MPLATSPGGPRVGAGTHAPTWRAEATVPPHPPPYRTDEPSRVAPLLAEGSSSRSSVGEAAPAASWVAEGPDPPPEFVCPISMAVMRDPVMLPTGQTYDRASIERWLSSGRATCPATGQQLEPPVPLVPNVSLRHAICSWAKRHAPWLVDPGTNDLKRDSSLLEAYVPGRDEGGPGAGRGWPAAANPAGPWAAPSGVPGGPRATDAGAPGGPRPRPRRARPADRREARLVAGLLVAALGAGYITTYVLALRKSGWELANVATNPFLGADVAGLVALGARSQALVQADGQWWRLFSSPWVPPGALGLASLLVTAGPLARHAAGVLPRPLLSLPLIVLPAALVGSCVSATLNVRYVTAGGAAPVAALLGIAWADQLIRGAAYRRRLVNTLVLLVVTALLALLSLAPMQDFWGAAGSFVAAFCLGSIGVLAGPGGGKPEALSRTLPVGVLAGLTFAVVAGFAAAGVAVHSDAGERCGAACSKLSCVPLKHWRCLPIDAWGGGCGLSLNDPSDLDAGASVLCPSNIQVAIVAGPKRLSKALEDGDVMRDLCQTYCTFASSDAGDGSSTENSPDQDDDDEGSDNEDGDDLDRTSKHDPPPPPPATTSFIGVEKLD